MIPVSQDEDQSWMLVAQGPGLTQPMCQVCTEDFAYCWQKGNSMIVVGVIGWVLLVDRTVYPLLVDFVFRSPVAYLCQVVSQCTANLPDSIGYSIFPWHIGYLQQLHASPTSSHVMKLLWKSCREFCCRHARINPGSVFPFWFRICSNWILKASAVTLAVLEIPFLRLGMVMAFLWVGPQTSLGGWWITFVSPGQPLLLSTDG